MKTKYYYENPLVDRIDALLKKYNPTKEDREGEELDVNLVDDIRLMCRVFEYESRGIALKLKKVDDVLELQKLVYKIFVGHFEYTYIDDRKVHGFPGMAED